MLGALLLLTSLSPAVSAHAMVLASTPAPNTSLPTGASVLAIRFSETVDPDRTTATILRENGTALETTTIEVPRSPQVLRFRTSPLDEGTYTLRWAALSLDGDLTRGSLAFTVGPGPTPSGEPAQPWDPAPDEPTQRTITGGLGTLLVAGMLLPTGAVFFWLRIHRLSTVPDRHATIALGLTALAPAGAIGTLWDLSNRLDTSLALAATTTAGQLTTILAGITTVQLALAVWARARPPARRRGPLGALVALGVLALLTDALGGHAIAGDAIGTAAGDLLLLANLVHVLAVCLWAGGLVALTVIATSSGRTAIASAIRRFSPWALASVALLALTGLVMALDALTRPADLWTTGYGRLLAAKTVGLTALVGFGAWHRWRAGPGLRRVSTGGRSRTRRVLGTLAGETATMVAVVGLAALLAVSPLPANPIDPADGPPVGQSHPVRFGDYEGEILLPDPLVAGADQVLWIHLVSSSFAPADALEPRLLLAPLDQPGADRVAADLVRMEPGLWMANGALFPSQGAWSVLLEVDGPRGPAHTELSVRVHASGPLAG